MRAQGQYFSNFLWDPIQMSGGSDWALSALCRTTLRWGEESHGQLYKTPWNKNSPDRQLQKTESRGKSGGHQTHRVTSPFYLELSARPCVVVDVCVVRKTTERGRCRWSHTATHLRRAQHPRRSWKTSPSVFTTMPFSVNGILCTLALLVLWRAEELVEACSCAPVHPQQAFCNADVGESSRGVYSCCCLCCCCLCLPGLSCSEPGSCTAN